jgi:phosphoribosylglycinamide formyltransferase-1
MAQDNGKINGQPKKLAVFASGTGTNAAKLIDHFRNNPKGEIGLIVCNKPGAGVIQIADCEGIDVLLIEKEQWFRGDGYVGELKSRNIDYIILAGFLWKLPSSVIQAWPGKILNIHPALLPKYGGKGMYGKFVHDAVIAAGDTESGITIHVVDEQYDHGPNVFQATCPVLPGDNADELAARIHELEHRYYPEIVEKFISKP